MKLPKYSVTELSPFEAALQVLAKGYVTESEADLILKAAEAAGYTRYVGAAENPQDVDFEFGGDEDWEPLGGGNYRHSPHLGE